MPSALPFLGFLLAASPLLPAQDGTRLLEGRVLDVLGDPIPAATVRVVANGRSERSATTDGEGVYRLRAPAAGAVLMVAAPGKVTERLAWRGAATPRVRNLVLEDAGTLRGRVTDASGRAVPQAMVVAAARTASATTMTDADGHYELTVPLRRVLVRALDANGCKETETAVTGETTLDLELAHGLGSCFVQVGGLPADTRGGRLRVFGPDLAAVIDGGIVPLRDDATAQVLLRDHCLVQATVPGQRIEPNTRLVGPCSGRVDYFASPAAAPAGEGALLRGSVKSSTGRPIAHVHVVLRDRSHCDLATVVADRSGTFALRLTLPHDGFVRAGLALGDGILLHDEVTIVDGFSWAPHTSGTSEAIELFTETTSLLQGIVRAPNGSPLAYADVTVVDSSQPHRPLVELRSDLAGRIEIGLPFGEHELLAVAANGAVCRGMVRVTDGRTPEPKWQQLETGVVEGTVHGPDGRPLGTVEVWLGVQGTTEANASERQSIRVRTDRNGRFRCRGLTTGTWTVGVDHDGVSVHTEAEVTANGTQTLQLAVAGR